MEKLKQYIVFTVLGCIAVMAVGWFLLVSPKRSEAADLRGQAASQVSANAQLETQLQILKAQAKDLPKQQAKLAAISARIPDNPALPQLIRALTAAGSAAGVELLSVSPGTPTAAGTGAATAARPAGASSAGQLGVIPLSLNVAGGFFQTQQFIANLENLPRSMRILNLALVPGVNPMKVQLSGGTGEDGKVLSTTIAGQIYMAANRPPTTAVVVPGKPTGNAAAPITGTATVTAPVAPAKK